MTDQTTTVQWSIETAESYRNTGRVRKFGNSEDETAAKTFARAEQAALGVDVVARPVGHQRTVPEWTWEAA